MYFVDNTPNGCVSAEQTHLAQMKNDQLAAELTAFHRAEAEGWGLHEQPAHSGAGSLDSEMPPVCAEERADVLAGVWVSHLSTHVR